MWPLKLNVVVVSLESMIMLVMRIALSQLSKINVASPHDVRTGCCMGSNKPVTDFFLLIFNAKQSLGTIMFRSFSSLREYPTFFLGDELYYFTL